MMAECSICRAFSRAMVYLHGEPVCPACEQALTPRAQEVGRDVADLALDVSRSLRQLPTQRLQGSFQL